MLQVQSEKILVLYYLDHMMRPKSDGIELIAS